MEIISKPIFIPVPNQHQPNLDSTDLLQGSLIYSVVGISVQKSEIHLPFKLYILENSNWIIRQDMYNSIRENVPNIQITQTPRITILGDESTLIIVDGIRYDASILKVLNPTDIECIKVSNNPVAEVYFALR